MKKRTRQIYLISLIGMTLSWTGCKDPSERISSDETKARVQNGLEAIGVFDYKLALRELKSVPDSLEPGTSEWTRAAFGLASALRYVQPATEANIEASRELFTQVAEEGNDPNARALALLELAREQEIQDFKGEKTNVEEARELYRHIREEYAGETFADEATIRLANTYFTRDPSQENYATGIQLLSEHISEYPKSKLAVVIWQQIGEAEDRLRNDRVAALAAYEQARQLGFTIPMQKDTFLWRMSQLAERTGQLEKAIDLYQRIIVETPRAHEVILSRRRLEELAAAHPEKNIKIPQTLDIITGKTKPASKDLETKESKL